MAEYDAYKLDYTAEQINSAVGNTVPVIRDGYWWRWDVEAMEYVDTGVKAEGKDGKDGGIVPENAGSVGQVLTRTAGGSAWRDAVKPLLPRVSVTTEPGASVTAALGSTTVGPVVADSNGKATVELPGLGEWTVTAEIMGVSHSEIAIVENVQLYLLDVYVKQSRIYGATWDGTSTTKWTRIDAAQNLTDPVPYIAGATEYGSPFDDVLPWAGMVRVSDEEAGELVAIPKFWYQLTQDGAGMTIRISGAARDDFHVSPAHMDRGDGKGERDVVYIGRYKCDSSFRSVTNANPKFSKRARSRSRTDIHNLGSTIWLSDFAMRFTIWLLYLVEFADWNSQACIGAGGYTDLTGNTDSMPYHTGTPADSRATTARSLQYRNIEGLWGVHLEHCDGGYFNADGLNLILNPSNYSDSEGGVFIGKTTASGFPHIFTVSDAIGYPVFYGSGTQGSETTYCCDRWYSNQYYPCLCVDDSGSGYGRDGLFRINADSLAGEYDVSLRLMKLPDPS